MLTQKTFVKRFLQVITVLAFIIIIPIHVVTKNYYVTVIGITVFGVISIVMMYFYKIQIGKKEEYEQKRHANNLIKIQAYTKELEKVKELEFDEKSKNLLEQIWLCSCRIIDLVAKRPELMQDTIEIYEEKGLIPRLIQEVKLREATTRKDRNENFTDLRKLRDYKDFLIHSRNNIFRVWSYLAKK